MAVAILERSRRGRVAFMQRLRNSESEVLRDIARAISIDFVEGITVLPQYYRIMLRDKDRRAYPHKCVKKMLIGDTSCKCKKKTLKL